MFVVCESHTGEERLGKFSRSEQGERSLLVIFGEIELRREHMHEMSAREGISELKKMKFVNYTSALLPGNFTTLFNLDNFSTQRNTSPTHVLRSEALKNHLRIRIPMQRSVGCMKSSSSLSIPGALNSRTTTPTTRKIWQT